MQKVLGSIRTFCKTLPYCLSGHIYKKVRHDPGMIDRFTVGALQKCCKKCAKSARINLYFSQNLTVLPIQSCLQKSTAHPNMIDQFTVEALQKCCKKVCEKCSDQLVLFAKLDCIVNLVMFTEKYDVIWAWLIDLQYGHCKNIAKKCAKSAWIKLYFQNLIVLPIRSFSQKCTTRSEHDWSSYRGCKSKKLQKVL